MRGEECIGVASVSPLLPFEPANLAIFRWTTASFGTISAGAAQAYQSDVHLRRVGGEAAADEIPVEVLPAQSGPALLIQARGALAEGSTYRLETPKLACSGARTGEVAVYEFIADAKVPLPKSLGTVRADESDPSTAPPFDESLLTVQLDPDIGFQPWLPYATYELWVDGARVVDPNIPADAPSATLRVACSDAVPADSLRFEPGLHTVQLRARFSDPADDLATNAQPVELRCAAPVPPAQCAPYPVDCPTCGVSSNTAIPCPLYDAEDTRSANDDTVHHDGRGDSDDGLPPGCAISSTQFVGSPSTKHPWVVLLTCCVIAVILVRRRRFIL